jgi:protein TonB
MSYIADNKQKIDEIVFANRNKAYGAYAIRSAYGNTVFRSLSFMIMSMATLLSIAWYFVNRQEIIDNSGQVAIAEGIKITEVIFEPKKTEVPKNAAPKGNTPRTNAVSTIIADTAAAVTNTVTNDIIPISTGPSTGTGTETIQGPTGNGTGSIITTATVETQPLMIADSEPEFEGGVKGLYKYLSKNLRYPEPAREAGVEGTVHVRFVVDETGKVILPIAQNKVGYGFEEEALRVINNIPRFRKPGMDKGKAVKVYFNLPIKFRLDK